MWATSSHFSGVVAFFRSTVCWVQWRCWCDAFIVKPPMGVIANGHCMQIACMAPEFNLYTQASNAGCKIQIPHLNSGTKNNLISISFYMQFFPLKIKLEENCSRSITRKNSPVFSACGVVCVQFISALQVFPAIGRTTNCILTAYYRRQICDTPTQLQN